MKRSGLLTTFIVGSCTLGSMDARATLTPFLLDWTPGTSIAYGVDLTSGHLQAGDGFTIFDVGEFTSVLDLPEGWTLSSTGNTHNPWGTDPAGPDDPTVVNLTFTYDGAIVHQEFGRSTYSPFLVGTTAAQLSVNEWTSRDHALEEVEGVYVPGVPHTDSIFTPAAPGVPDGGTTVLLLGTGLIGLVALRRRMGVSLGLAP